MTTALLPSATIYQMEAARARVLELYAQAFELLGEADKMAHIACPASYTLPFLAADRSNAFGIRDAESLEKAVRVPLDRSIWLHLLRVTKLDTLMDATAKEQFRAQLETDPPPATADNCLATIEQLRADSGEIFKRGIATVFSKLDRRFRSHDGFKVGSRVVITYFADSNGWPSSHRSDVLLDIERTFAVLDGKPTPERAAGIVGALGTARPRGLSAAAYQAESDYFTVKVFKNGNAHVWFKRDDLVERVNLLLAEYYGAALGAAPDVADVKAEPNRTPAKNFGLFETPIAVADQALDQCKVWTDRNTSRRQGEPLPVLRILEPSAGRGRLALRAAGWGHKVTAVEIQGALAAELGAMGVLEKVLHSDFFDVTTAQIGQFDRVVMNPPFDGQRDIDHVNHAVQFLKPGGVLVAIMSASFEFRENAKAVAFRAMVERMRGEIRDLPPGSFKESGTMVNTVLVTLRA